MTKRKRGKRGSRKNKRIRELIRPFAWTMWNDEMAEIYRAINVYIDAYNKGKRYAQKTWKLRQLLLKLSESQNHRCCYCGVETWHPDLYDGIIRSKRYSSRTRATLEHLITRSNGGKDNPDNLVMACHECNNARNDMDIAEFIEVIIEETPLESPDAKPVDMEKALRDQQRLLIRLITVCTFFPDEFQISMEDLNEQEKETIKLSAPKRLRYTILNRIKKRVAANQMDLIGLTQ